MNIINIASFIVGTFSLVLAIIAVVMAFNRRILQFNIFNSELINSDEKLSKVEFLYDKKPIDRLTISKVIFWNNSLCNAIKSKDIPTTELLTISLKRGKILEAFILKGDKTSNLISLLDVGVTEFHLSFEYLDKKEGAIIQIIHTGNENDIIISGKIINGNVIVKQQYNGYIQSAIKTFSRLALIVFTCISTYTILPFTDISIIQNWYIEKMKFMNPNANAIVSYFIFVIIVLMSVFIDIASSTIRKFTPKNCKE